MDLGNGIHMLRRVEQGDEAAWTLLTLGVAGPVHKDRTMAWGLIPCGCERKGARFLA